MLGEQEEWNYKDQSDYRNGTTHRSLRAENPYGVDDLTSTRMDP